MGMQQCWRTNEEHYAEHISFRAVLDDVSSVESYSSDESSAKAAPVKGKKAKTMDSESSSKAKTTAASTTVKKSAAPKKAGQQSLFGYMKKK